MKILLPKGILVFFLCLYVETTCHSIPIGCNGTTDSIALSLAQSLQGIANALLVNSQTSCSGSASTTCCPIEPSPLPTSCKEIKTKWPHSISGYYLIGCKKEPMYVYCHMEELCSSGGGWTRIAYLDMSDSTEVCPPGFKLYQSGGLRACGRQSSNSAGCQSVKFPSYGNYSQVCGRLLGYQYGSPNAIHSSGIYGTGHNDINSHYVDGVSLTHDSPRQHIWTFMAGNSEKGNSHHNCPCNQGTTQTVQSFIGNNYFCESGNPYVYTQTKLYTADPLWDGKGCSSLEQTCCQTPGLPWFHKVLNSTTTDYIELRVCADEGINNEDIPVNYYEIYVK